MQRAAIMIVTLVTAGSAMVSRGVEPLPHVQHRPAIGIALRTGAVSYPLPAFKFFGRVGQNTTGLVCAHGDFRDGYRFTQKHRC